MAATLDLIDEYRIEQGADFRARLRPTSATLDFTGATARGQIRKKYSEATTVASFTITSGSDAEGFYLDLTLTAAETALLPVLAATSISKRSTFYCYDVELVLAGGSVIRLIEGQVEVSPEVTK